MSQGDGEIDQFVRSGTAAFSLVTDYEDEGAQRLEQSNEAGNDQERLSPSSADATSGTIGYVRLYSITLADMSRPGNWFSSLEVRMPLECTMCPSAGLGVWTRLLTGSASTRTLMSVTQSLAGSTLDLLQEQAKYAINRAYRFVPYFSDWEIEAWAGFQENHQRRR